MSIKTKIRAYLIGKYVYVHSVHIRGDGVIHAKNVKGKPIFSFRMRDFKEVPGGLKYKGINVK